MGDGSARTQTHKTQRLLKKKKKSITSWCAPRLGPLLCTETGQKGVVRGLFGSNSPKAQIFQTTQIAAPDKNERQRKPISPPNEQVKTSRKGRSKLTIRQARRYNRTFHQDRSWRKCPPNWGKKGSEHRASRFR